jgi:hypothetical protein
MENAHRVNITRVEILVRPKPSLRRLKVTTLCLEKVHEPAAFYLVGHCWGGMKNWKHMNGVGFQFVDTS